ncbi:MAG: VOC family protein [Pseudomonadota bacterium]
MKQLAPLEVGLPVEDLERMLDFYLSVLGCTEVRRADIAPELSRRLAVGREGYVNVWLRTPGGEVIKLMAPPDPPEREAVLGYSSERTGFRYLTFYCEAIEDVLAKAEAAGATLRSERALLDGELGVKLCFFADPEGNVIELVEPAPQN